MTDHQGTEHEFTDPEAPGRSDSTPPLATAEQRMALMVRNFDDPSLEWRRVCAEVFGTFFLVLVAAGGPMIDHSLPGSVGRAAAVVAPGIAEALLATATGLVAAIPAVIIYNHFSRQTKSYLELVNRASGSAGRLLSRDLDVFNGRAPIRAEG